MKKTVALSLALTGALGAATAAFAQEGDAEAGEAAFAICKTCHSADTAWIGPNLAGVIGREAGAQPDFGNYTQALKDSGLVWTEETLDEFLASPFTVVQGTAMVLPTPDPQTRANLIAYLKTLDEE